MESNRPECPWVEQFERDGYTVIEDFASAEECDELKAEMYNVMNGLDITAEHKKVFSTVNGQQQWELQDDYMYTSGDKVRCFFEEGALNEKGELVVPKEQSLNKVGHALHWYNDVFKRFSFSDKMKSLAKSFGLANPAIIQSMYIFNHPNTETYGEICPHQDSSFLWMEPLKLYGLWLAVDDATEESGCVWFVPGSHQDGKRLSNEQMWRAKKEVNEDGHVTLKHSGQSPGDDHSKYTPCPVKKGSLVLIHGLVAHKNFGNKTDKSGNVYTLHFIEQDGTKWSPDNWLQPSDDLPFTPLYQN